MAAPRSHIECLGAERTRCGYCHTRYSSRNFGVWAHRLDVRDYQALLDAGWRRSGAYLYRPDLVTTCCPCYVIRLNAARYTPSVSHKRVLKRLRRFAASPALSPADSAMSGAEPPKLTSDCEPHPILRHSRPAVSAEAVQLRESITSAVNDAVETALQQAHRGSFPNSDVVEQARPAIKVFPPRKSSSTKRKPSSSRASSDRSGSPQSAILQPEEHSSSASGVPVLLSNVAMVLAAVERRMNLTESARAATFNQRGNPSSKKKDAAVQRAAKEKQKKRQMELASTIAKHVRESSTSQASVTVTEPGFLNFWRKGEIEEFEEPELMAEGPETEKRIDVEDMNASSLNHRLRHVGGSQAEKLGAILPTNTIPLSRIGSDISSEHTGGAQDFPSPAPEIVQSPSEKVSLPTSSTPHLVDIGEDLSGSKSFSMEFVPSQFRLEAYEIFRKYQMAVHREPAEQCGEDTYRRFLVDTPLVQSRSPLDPGRSYGSFHIMYRIRGRLFAVGVVDVLPRCLSSVYLFYDPDFSRLSPGTLSALNEIEWVKRASAVFPALQFYYMGYYIHSCPKMRYKATYHPSEILCEETKNWIPADDVKALLENTQGRKLRLAPPTMRPAAEAESFRLEEGELQNLTDESRLQISFGQDGMRIISLRTLERILPVEYREHVERLRRKVSRFVSLVGKVSAKFYLHDV